MILTPRQIDGRVWTLKHLVECWCCWLNPRDAEVIRLYFGLGDNREHNFSEIGEELGVSSERARQLCDRALKRLRSITPP